MKRLKMAAKVLAELNGEQPESWSKTSVIRFIELKTGKEIESIIQGGSLRDARKRLLNLGFDVHYSTIRNWRVRLGIN